MEREFGDGRTPSLCRPATGWEPITDVCREFGISRKTGYKIFNRYREHGCEAFSDRTRRPVRHANQLPQQVESLIVTLPIERAMYKQDWQDAGAGWQGKDGELRPVGWSQQRRIVILRRRIERSLLIERHPGQLSLGFAEIDGRREVWEYAVLVTSLGSEILTIGQLYRDTFDELKNHWGWAGLGLRHETSNAVG